MKDEACCSNGDECCCDKGKGDASTAPGFDPDESGTSGFAELRRDKMPGRPSGPEARFKEFMKAAGKPGALDAATKQAVNIALSTLAKCEPCLKTHIQKARGMGFSEEEIDEAAWLAISFGGCPAMMFYNGVKQEMQGRR